MTQQLVLPLESKNLLDFDSFYPTKNEFTLNTLEFWPEKEPYLFLQGPHGSGKTHLAEALAKKNLAQGKQILFLSALSLKNYTRLDALSYADLIIIDDFHTLFPSNDATEMMLFHFYNHLLSQASRLLLVSEKKLPQLPIHLNDLASRLKTGLQVYLKPLSGEDLAKIIPIHAKRLSLHLSPEVEAYLLHHLSRDAKTLVLTLEKLAHDSLRDGRRLTLPYVRNSLSEGSL